MVVSWGLFGGLSWPLGGSFEASFVAPGASWGLLGGFLGSLGALLGLPGASWGRRLEMSVRVSPLWPLWRPSWGSLGPSWGLLVPSWGLFRPSWSALRGLVGRLGALLGACWAVLGRSSGLFGLLSASGRREGEKAKNIGKHTGKSTILASRGSMKAFETPQNGFRTALV